jgi:diguanylate cyclase (GGDEF)-like protein
MFLQLLDEFLESLGIPLENGLWDYLFDGIQIVVSGIAIYFFLNYLEKYARNSYLKDSYLRTVVENMDEGVAVCDKNGNLIFMNDTSSFRMTKRTLPKFPIPYEKWPLYWDLYESDGTTKIILEEIPLIKALRGEDVTNQKLISKRSGAPSQYLSINGKQLKSKSGEIIGALIVLHDITDQKKSEEKIKHMAYHDALTGLPNLRFFKEKLTDFLDKEQLENDSNMLSVMFLDLDGFKAVNDQFGHEVGDMLLQEVCKRISRCLKDSDIAARIGGDEFTVLMPELKTKEDAILMANTIIEEVGAPYEIQGRKVRVTISIGISFSPQDGTVKSELMRNADLAMYSAKNSGKNQYCVFRNDNSLLT